MTPTMGSLKNNGVIAKTGDASKVVARENVNYDKLRIFARNVAEFFELPKDTPFIEGGHAAQLFDFSSRSMCKSPCKILEVKHAPAQLMVSVVGDALLEPFWPEGLGVNRGFLSCYDMCYCLTEWFSTGQIEKKNHKKFMKTAEKLFNINRCLSAHTKMETLRENHALFSLDPNTRYLKWKHGS